MELHFPRIQEHVFARIGREALKKWREHHPTAHSPPRLISTVHSTPLKPPILQRQPWSSPPSPSQPSPLPSPKQPPPNYFFTFRSVNEAFWSKIKSFAEKLSSFSIIFGADIEQLEALWLAGAMVDRAVHDGSPAEATAAGEKAGKKLGRKRKRSLLGEKLSNEEKEALASNYRRVVDSLLVHMKEFVGSRVGLEEVGAGGALPLSDSVVACLVEESGLPFKNLVQEVYQRLEVEDGVTVASVGSAVLRVGERSMCGVEKKEADVMEDESESCIWCWEIRVLR